MTVDQPQVKGAHVRFKKLVQIGESWFFQCVGVNGVNSVFFMLEILPP